MNNQGTRDRVLFSVIFIAMMWIYTATLAPGITIANMGMDTGEFALAARDLGIPHPTGYPVFNLLGKIFILNPLLRDREIAYRTNLLSAFFGALTVGIVFLIARKITCRPLIAFFTALSFGVTRTFWSQAVITEVYTLNLFFVSLFFLFVVHYISSPASEKYFWGITFAFGMGFTNHTMVVLLVPVYIYIILLNPSIITVRKTCFGVLIISLCALSYLYLPIRAVKDPLINIGNPVSPAQISWVMLAKPFQNYMFSLPSGKFYYQGSAFPLFEQFTILEFIIGIIGFWELFKQESKLCWSFILLFVLNVLYSLNYEISDIAAYFLMSYMIFSLWIGYGMKSIFEKSTPVASKYLAPGVIQAVIAVFLLLIFNVHFRSNFGIVSEPERQEAVNYARDVFNIMEKNSVLVVLGGNLAHTVLYYKHETLRGDGADILDANWIIWKWYLEQVKRRAHVKIPEINLDKLRENVNNKYGVQIRESASKFAVEIFLRNEIVRLIAAEVLKTRPVYTNCSYPILENEFYFAKIRKGLYKLALKPERK